MNVTLLKQVRDYIKAHPTKYDQHNFCGTACCIAGHAAILSGAMTSKAVTKDEFLDTVRAVGRAVLQLDEDQAALLLDSYDFKYTPFSIEYEDDPKRRAALAVKRINHFIKTKGAE